MKTLSRFVLAAGLLSLSAVVAHARIERTLEKAFTVTSAGKLKVETQGGEIRVVPSTDSTVRVKARQRINATTDAEADELLRKLEMTLEQSGNDVRLSAKYERQPAGSLFRSWPPVNVDFEVSVPAAFVTDLSTSGGAITVGNLDGNAEVRTSGGGIKLGKMGGTVEARTSGGGISLEEARGRVELKTSGGNITVGRVAGPAELATSGGSIKIDSVANLLRAHTSGGSIRANIVGPLSEECSLSTSGGSVSVNVDRGAAFRLDAATSGGGVDVQGLAVQTEKPSRDRSRVAGTVNGGGPLLKLRTSGGSINVRAN